MQAALPMGNNKITGMADPTISTDGATKNYVDTTTATFFSTGDAKITLKSVADTGWVICNDGTIGSATSGASTRANADTQALFTLIFNNISDSWSIVFTAGGGAQTTRAAQGSASAAWASNCQISLPKVLGRALASAGNNGGPAGTWALGQNYGTEVVTLAASQIPTITSSASATFSASVTSTNFVASNASDSTAVSAVAGGSAMGVAASGGTVSHIGSTGTASGSVSSTSSNTSGGSHNNMQPTSFWNVMIKL